VRLAPGAAQEGHRHGALSTYTVFNTKTGEVLGKTAAHKTEKVNKFSEPISGRICWVD
jgi:hypothetical protein